MSRTTILFFHDAPARSRANAALLDAVRELPHLDVADMGTLYPDGVIDVDAEVERLLSANRIVLQFPVQWYSTPPLLKAWQDAVLTRIYYVNPKVEGDRLAGLPVTVAAGREYASHLRRWIAGAGGTSRAEFVAEARMRAA